MCEQQYSGMHIVYIYVNINYSAYLFFSLLDSATYAYNQLQREQRAGS